VTLGLGFVNYGMPTSHAADLGEATRRHVTRAHVADTRWRTTRHDQLSSQSHLPYTRNPKHTLASLHSHLAHISSHHARLVTDQDGSSLQLILPQRFSFELRDTGTVSRTLGGDAPLLANSIHVTCIIACTGQHKLLPCTCQDGWATISGSLLVEALSGLPRGSCNPAR
jgi:hypothetical protein